MNSTSTEFIRFNGTNKNISALIPGDFIRERSYATGDVFVVAAIAAQNYYVVTNFVGIDPVSVVNIEYKYIENILPVTRDK